MSSSSVKSAERSLHVLEILAAYARPVPTMTIVRDSGIPKSSAHHLLNVLRERGFVTHYEAERSWGLGVKAFEIGSAYMRSGPLQRHGRLLLGELTQCTGETSHLAILSGTDVLYIDKEQTDGMTPKLVTEIGVRLPAHLTSVGRAILSALPAARVRAMYAAQPLVRRTGRGPTDIETLLRDLVAVDELGYAFDDEMVTPGICCVAAPVFANDGAPAAAVGITYVGAQRDRRDVDSLATTVRETAKRLSASLGWQPSEIAPLPDPTPAHDSAVRARPGTVHRPSQQDVNP